MTKGRSTHLPGTCPPFLPHWMQRPQAHPASDAPAPSPLHPALRQPVVVDAIDLSDQSSGTAPSGIGWFTNRCVPARVACMTCSRHSAAHSRSSPHPAPASLPFPSRHCHLRERPFTAPSVRCVVLYLTVELLHASHSMNAVSTLDFRLQISKSSPVIIHGSFAAQTGISCNFPVQDAKTGTIHLG